MELNTRPRLGRGGSAGMKETTMMYGYGNPAGGWGYALMAVSMILFWGR